MTESGAIKYFYKRMELGDIENDTQQYAYETAIDALEEIQKYKALGTVEELRIAKEKQIPKKPVIERINIDKCITELEYECPICKMKYIELTPCGEYCQYCGQYIDWSDSN